MNHIALIKKQIIALFGMVLICSVSLSAVPVQLLTTAEIHGTIGAGHSSKAGGIAGIRSAASLLGGKEGIWADAGGFSAGGIYDLQTGGKRFDSVRTELCTAEMISFPYSAVNLGDEECAYGAERIQAWIRAGLPAVSANAVLTGEPAVKKSITIPGKLPLFITGVTTEEPLLEIGPGVTVLPAEESLEKVLAQAPDSAAVVLLAHLTPEEIETVIRRFPRIDLVVRGHRAGSAASVDTVLGKPVVNFGFEGSSAGRTEILSPRVSRTESIPVSSAEIPPLKPAPADPVECFIMSGCPGGTAAVRELLEIEDEMGSAFEWRLSFFGDLVGDTLLPGLKSGSAADEMLVTAVKSLYPARFSDFLWLMTEENGTVGSAVSQMHLDTAALGRWVREFGEQSLKIQYRRALRLSVSASPSLFVRNRYYEPELSADRYLFDLCRSGRSDLFCDTFGECLSHADCEPAEGKSVRCDSVSGKKMECRIYTDSGFTMIQILPDDSSYHEENDAVRTTRQLFPSVRVKTFRLHSIQGDSLTALFSPKALPFYLFDSAVVRTANYDQIAEGLIGCRGGFRFRDSVMSGNFYYRRPREPGRMVFIRFDSPLYRSLQKEHPELAVFPAYDQSRLDDPAIRDELIRRGTVLSAKEFYDQRLSGIAADSPVWVLENNQKVLQASSPEQFEQIISK